jgi:[ribosomal protein S5]-alanine N-acetyltransferase
MTKVADDHNTMWQTPRLTIRHLRPDDWSDLHALQGDPEATKFIGGVWSPEKTREVINRIAAGYPTNQLTWFAVEDRTTDRVVGVCWLGERSSKWCRMLGWGREIELGYRYARQHWNKGYATEAARAMLHRGFHELNLKRIVAIVDVRNIASERVLQKLGMTLVASGTTDDLTIRGYRIEADEYCSAQCIIDL